MKNYINDEALAIIKDCEGFSAKPYLCPAGYLTIGYGHRIMPGEKFDNITLQKANELLLYDIQKAAKAVDRYVKVPLTENQLGALVSFVYNVGIGNFKESTLLKKLNDNHYKDAAQQFGRWIYSNKKVLQGLVNRREKERQLFMKA